MRLLKSNRLKQTRGVGEIIRENQKSYVREIEARIGKVETFSQLNEVIREASEAVTKKFNPESVKAALPQDLVEMIKEREKLRKMRRGKDKELSIGKNWINYYNRRKWRKNNQQESR